jgi:hypothetical protein
MPSNNSRRRGRTSKNRQNSSSTDQLIAQSSTVVGRGFVEVPKQDFGRRPPSWMLNQTPPRSVRNQIYWIQGKNHFQTTISNSVPTEYNFGFTFADLADLVGLAAFFDQYCIYSVTVNLTPDFEGAGSTLYTFGTVATAIDYDNVNNVGTFAQVESYASCVIQELTSGQSLQRYIKPCVAPALYSSSAAFSGYGVNRMWVDSSVTSVPHYGFRSLFISNTVSGLSVSFDVNYIVGLRNNI